MEQKYLYFGNVGNKYVFMISLIYAASQSQEHKRSGDNCDVWLGLKLFPWIFLSQLSFIVFVTQSLSKEGFVAKLRKFNPFHRYAFFVWYFLYIKQLNLICSTPSTISIKLILPHKLLFLFIVGMKISYLVSVRTVLLANTEIYFICFCIKIRYMYEICVLLST